MIAATPVGCPSQFVEEHVNLHGYPFSFRGREYLKAIYDSPYSKRFIKSGRQCEKCVHITEKLLMADGSWRRAEDVVVGDQVATLDLATNRMTSRRVVWRSSISRKPCLHIQTYAGHGVIVSTTHPLRLQDRWTESANLDVGTRVVYARTSDIGLDKIKSIKEVGEKQCIDFEVEGTHNFVVGGLITHNSTTLSNLATSLLYCNAFTNGLYVSSSAQQTGVFSGSVFKAMLMESPKLRGPWYRPGSAVYTDKVYEKEFTNHSRMYFRYAFLSADRVRGVSAKDLFLDEMQDILLKNIPIIEECTSHFMADRLWTYSGTPKTFENAMETYWRRSTMKEWVVKCRACGFWNVLGETNVQQQGLSCEKCEKVINARDGMWARFGPEDADFDGFRLSQLMVPWVVWKEIWVKYKTYPKQQFFNEVLGLSCETTASVLTQIDIMRACSLGGFQMFTGRPTDRYYQALFGGVDWGKGLGSYTVHVIGGFHDGKWDTIYMKKYDPSRMETREIVRDIAKVNFKFRVIKCGADWGSGYMENQELQRASKPIRVWQFYSSGTQKAMVSFNRKGRFFVINRNSVIGELFHAIKQGRIRLFRWKEFQTFAPDFLAVFPDYHTHTRVLYYNHPADIPDDAVHATNYARVSAMIYHGMLSGLREN